MVSIDFEFKNSKEAVLDLVCCAYRVDEGETVSVWLYKDPVSKEALKCVLQAFKHHTMIAYYASAEARCFESLGLDPLEFEWADACVAYRWCTNKAGYKDARKHDLVSACFSFDIPYRNTHEEKDVYRDLILTNETYTDESKEKILRYCCDDTEVLKSLLDCCLARIRTVYMIPSPELNLKNFSDWTVACGKIETLGIPLDVPSVENLMANHRTAIRYFVKRLSYPFFDADLKEKYDAFVSYITGKGYAEQWPITEKGAYRRDDKTLQLHAYDDDLKALRSTKKLISKFKLFNPSKSPLLSSIGSDGKLRCMCSPFGTQTARNAASNNVFIFAFSTVFRALIKPPPGLAITVCDYSQEEILIAGALSGDKKICESYACGDPYWDLVKLAGAAPKEAKKTDSKEYSLLRAAFKSTLLGLFYGMGQVSLRAKLRTDTGYDFSKDEALRLITLVKAAYPTYWRWVAEIDKMCARSQPLTLDDGWSILSDKNKVTSVRNWPIQSIGSYILRSATVKAMRSGMSVIATYHDSIYIMHPEEDKESPFKLQALMISVANEVLKCPTSIRADMKTHFYNEIWIDPKGEALYPEFKQFMTNKIEEDLL